MNRVWGLSMNPYNKDRTCGGSSGGDAGLVATRCVPLAIGTDLGGSMRIPSDFIGIYGFKATTQRVPISRFRGVLPHNFNPPFSPGGCIQPILGPMCRSARDVTSAMRAIFNSKSHNYNYVGYVAPTLFRENLHAKALKPRKIRIGYWESMPTVPSSAPIVRAARMAKKALVDSGYDVVNFSLTKA